MHCGLVITNALLFFSILSLIFRTTFTIVLRPKLVGCLSLTFEKGGSIISLHTESRCIRYSEKLPPLPCLLHVSRDSLGVKKSVNLLPSIFAIYEGLKCFGQTVSSKRDFWWPSDNNSIDITNGLKIYSFLINFIKQKQAHNQFLQSICICRRLA